MRPLSNGRREGVSLVCHALPLAWGGSLPALPPLAGRPAFTKRDMLIPGSVLRVMPDDNSCMFTAFGGAIALDDPARHLRQKVADYIMAHPEKYSKVILGDDPARYTHRMKQSDTWGGAIELSILSDIYDIEICSIDVKVDSLPLAPEGGAFRPSNQT